LKNYLNISNSNEIDYLGGGIILLYWIWLVTLIGVTVLQTYRLTNGVTTIFTYADLILSITGIIGSVFGIMRRKVGYAILLFISGGFFAITTISLTYRVVNELISPIIYPIFYLLVLSIISVIYLIEKGEFV